MNMTSKIKLPKKLRQPKKEEGLKMKKVSKIKTAYTLLECLIIFAVNLLFFIIEVVVKNCRANLY